MIVQAYGVVDASPIQISEILKALNVSHSLIGGFGRVMRLTIDGLAPEQPMWPVIVDRVKTIPKIDFEKDPMVLFVCDSRASLALSNANSSLWPENRPVTLSTGVEAALVASLAVTSPWSLVTSVPTLEDYVNLAAKPSFLNFVQGAFYKITPYSKRKEVQQMCIAYLAGAITTTAIKQYLKTSLKFATLLSLIDSPKALNLREAVAVSRSAPSLEQVCKDFDVQSFEILYIVRSYEQNKG